MWFKKLAFPLKTTLVGAVLLSATIAVGITVGMIGVPAYHRAKGAVKALWELVSQEVAGNATGQILQYFENAPITLRLIEGLVTENQLNSLKAESLFDTCYQTLKANPNFVTVYYSTIEGSFYGVFRLGGQYVASHRRVQEGSKTEVENYQLGAEGKWVLAGREVSDYDPRKRPFWNTGQNHPQGAWTEVYRFATSQATGYSYVLAQQSPIGIEGYWGVDFEIDGLSTYLSSLKIGEEGVVYIVGNDGRVIAQSKGKAPPLPGSVLFALGKEEKTEWIDLGRWVFYIHRFPLESQIPWNLVTMIHQHDFLLPIQKTALQSLGLGVIPFFIFLAISAFFFGKISRRLKQVAQEMNRAGVLSLEEESQPLFSLIEEVNQMNQSLSKMKLGLRSFSKYVPLDLVKKLISSGSMPQLGGEKKEITILFADLVQFTSFAEKVHPDEIIKVLEKFLAGVSREIHKEKGVIDKFMGDAVMALWGAPDPVENAPLAACRAALAMQKMAEEDARMNYKIGINTGTAIVGHFGSQERMDYTAIGDSVNIAARLEKLSKQYHTHILIGPNTAAAVEEVLLIRPIDWVTLEGRTRPLFIYELLREKEGASEEIIQAIATYTAALQAYRNRQFTLSAQLFEKANEWFGGGDLPSKILRERSLDFEKHPPSSDWFIREMGND